VADNIGHEAAHGHEALQLGLANRLVVVQAFQRHRASSHCRRAGGVEDGVVPEEVVVALEGVEDVVEGDLRVVVGRVRVVEVGVVLEEEEGVVGGGGAGGEAGEEVDVGDVEGGGEDVGGEEVADELEEGELLLGECLVVVEGLGGGVGRLVGGGPEVQAQLQVQRVRAVQVT